jgi:hypothetical protein
MKIAVSCDVILCFGRTSFLYLQDGKHFFPGDNNLHNYHNKNLKISITLAHDQCKINTVVLWVNTASIFIIEFDLEGGRGMFLRNFNNLLPDYTMA